MRKEADTIVFRSRVRPYRNGDITEPKNPLIEVPPNELIELRRAFAIHHGNQDLQDFIWSHRGFEPRMIIGNFETGLVVFVETSERAYARKIFDHFFSTEESRYTIVKNLLRFDNPCIVKIFGFYPPIELPHPYCLREVLEGGSFTMEYAEGGSLASLLKSQQKLEQYQKFIMLIGVAYGMKCVHEAGLLYKTLKPTNVLLRKNLEPMLGDFGTEPTSLDITPPEHENDCYIEWIEVPFTAPNDVYSFAMVAFTIVTGHQPFAQLDSQYASYLQWKGERDIFDQTDPCEELIKQCWAVNQEDRPSFALIFDQLCKLADSAVYEGKVAVHQYMNMLFTHMNSNSPTSFTI